MSKARLRKAVRGLPLDEWQSEASAKGIERLSEEEAEAIAQDLEDAFSELPEILDELSAILANKHQHGPLHI